MHAYNSLYLHCGPSTKVHSKLKSIDSSSGCVIASWLTHLYAKDSSY